MPSLLSLHSATRCHKTPTMALSSADMHCCTPQASPRASEHRTPSVWERLRAYRGQLANRQLPQPTCVQDLLIVSSHPLTLNGKPSSAVCWVSTVPMHSVLIRRFARVISYNAVRKIWRAVDFVTDVVNALDCTCCLIEGVPLP